LFVLNFDEIHAGGAEEFEVFVNGWLALMMGGVKMEEEGRRDIIGRGGVVDEVQYGIAFVHRNQSLSLINLKRGKKLFALSVPKKFHVRSPKHLEG
jgi:hypothetical protein